MRFSRQEYEVGCHLDHSVSLISYIFEETMYNQNPQREDKILINSESNETHAYKDVHECDSI